MKVFMIGGTGLLGLAAAKRFIEDGHHVTSLALPPIPKGVEIPKSMNLILENFSNMSDDSLMQLMKDTEVFVFAAGIDERVEGKAPIYDMYYQYNIKPLDHLLKIAKQARVKKAIILGSYFAYFERIWSDLDLYDNNPYIRSRVDQDSMAMKYSDDFMKVSILELPYIFGVQEGRKPVWVFLVEQIQKMKKYTFYPRGGTAMITVNQVGEVIVKVSYGEYQGNLPIGYYNIKWKEMLKYFHEEMGLKRKIISIPRWLYALGLSFVKKSYKKRGIESGLSFKDLAVIMDRNAYIPNELTRNGLLIKEDGLEKAIKDSVRLSLEIIKGKADIIGMKSE